MSVLWLGCYVLSPNLYNSTGEWSRTRKDGFVKDVALLSNETISLFLRSTTSRVQCLLSHRFAGTETKSCSKSSAFLFQLRWTTIEAIQFLKFFLAKCFNLYYFGRTCSGNVDYNVNFEDIWSIIHNQFL